MAEVLVAYPHNAPFISGDIRILSSHFQVEELKCGEGSRLSSVILRGMRSKVIVSWFALGYATVAAALSRIGGPRAVLITGGWDVATVPEISYGIMLSPRRRWKVVTALSMSDKVLAISRSIATDVRFWAPRSRVQVCPLGFDSEKFAPGGRKERKVLTVGNVTCENMLRKGLMTFLDVARLMPDIEFVLAGGGDSGLLSQLQRDSPANLRVTGRLTEDGLVKEMQSAMVYAQLSAHEGFGCALAEAMLCGCLPVVTDRGAIPEVVGNSGFYVPFMDAKTTREVLRRALDERDGQRARDRIRTKFPIAAREATLTRVIEDLIDGPTREESSDQSSASLERTSE